MLIDHDPPKRIHARERRRPHGTCLQTFCLQGDQTQVKRPLEKRSLPEPRHTYITCCAGRSQLPGMRTQHTHTQTHTHTHTTHAHTHTHTHTHQHNTTYTPTLAHKHTHAHTTHTHTNRVPVARRYGTASVCAWYHIFQHDCGRQRQRSATFS